MVEKYFSKLLVRVKCKMWIPMREEKVSWKFIIEKIKRVRHELKCFFKIFKCIKEEY